MSFGSCPAPCKSTNCWREQARSGDCNRDEAGGGIQSKLFLCRKFLSWKWMASPILYSFPTDGMSVLITEETPAIRCEVQKGKKHRELDLS